MSHFSVIVLLPANTKLEDANEAVEQLIAPYDENLTVPEYDRDCWCKGLQARNETWKVTMPKLDEARDEAGRRRSAGESEETIDAWWQGEILPPHKAREAELIAAHPLKDAPDSDCDTCNGTGTERTTYNPKSKWDWWRIGGRWDGWLTSAPKVDDGRGGFNFGEKFTKPERNACLVSALAADKVPYAIVTPDGAWSEKGQMGWWGMSSNEKVDWPEQAKGIFAAHPDALAVCIDCHI